MADRLRVGILISGRGSNMLALAEHRRRDAARPYEIVLVASNVPEARGLVLARRLGIPVWARSHEGVPREEFDRLLDAELRARDVEIVALAGYMRLLSDPFVAAWEARILNIHPSLLPAHKGLDTHRRAIEAGDLLAGCSVHLVTTALDDGPVLARAQLRIRPRETPERLAERVLAEEHRLYPQALDDYCRAILESRVGGGTGAEAREGPIG
ncbi:MAG: phosphoribosylglycinamide formyltransferase 1 [Sphingomonadales bacterium]|jgi:formyltetrahydrofolate-dependent phosphoribosylglycinamide formyltransferase|nr:phosphoribosylglycinamide formyltransferase 1 [Sphingomonadales bacterium]